MSLEAELHAIARARERYGLELSPVAYLALCTKIAAGEGLRMGASQTEPHRDVWCVAHEGHWLIAVYDPGPARIVTFLPFDRRPAKYCSKWRPEAGRASDLTHPQF